MHRLSGQLTALNTQLIDVRKELKQPKIAEALKKHTQFLVRFIDSVIQFYFLIICCILILNLGEENSDRSCCF